jgi:hypothetical protein
MSGIFLGKGITTSSAMRREAAPMEWIPFADVEFAECQHGYYFVYEKFDHLGVGCWFADYEERDNSPESREERFRLRGLSSIQEARLECEKHDIKIGSSTALQRLIRPRRIWLRKTHLSKAAKEKKP